MKIDRPVQLGIAAFVVVFMALTIVKSCGAPDESALQRAAQQAASAIATVEHADSVLAMHRADSIKLATLEARAQTDATIRRSLQRKLAVLEGAIPPAPIEVTDTAWHGRALGLDSALVDAKLLLALQDTMLTSQAETITLQRADNRRLASALQFTRDTLATHRTVVIPASAVRRGFSLRNILTVVGGYGPQYSGGKVTFGPQLTLGVRLPL